MKSYGEIDFEGRDAWFQAHGGDVFRANPLAWQRRAQLAKDTAEAGARAVIEEFCKRNNIAVPSEED
jgi:hypothetical protein